MMGTAQAARSSLNKAAGQHHTIVLDDASAVARVEYISAQAVDAHLCATPDQWPGLQSADALCRGEALEGSWFGYDRRNRLLKAGKAPPLPKTYTLKLHPLPHLAHLPLAEQRAAYAKMEEDVDLAAHKSYPRIRPRRGLRADDAASRGRQGHSRVAPDPSGPPGLFFAQLLSSTPRPWQAAVAGPAAVAAR